MQVQCLIQEFNSTILVLFLSPLNDGLEVSMIRSLLLAVTHFDQELKLLACVLKLILLDFAVNHSVKRGLVRLIILDSLLINLVGLLVIIQHALLERNLSEIIGILGLNCGGFIKHLQGLVDNGLSSAAVSGKHP